MERASAVVAVDEVDDVVAGIDGWERNDEAPMEPVVSDQKVKVFELKWFTTIFIFHLYSRSEKNV